MRGASIFQDSSCEESFYYNDILDDIDAGHNDAKVC